MWHINSHIWHIYGKLNKCNNCNYMLKGTHVSDMVKKGHKCSHLKFNLLIDGAIGRI